MKMTVLLKFSSEKHGRKRSVAGWGILQVEVIVFYCCGAQVLLALSSIAVVTSGTPWTGDMDQCQKTNESWLSCSADHTTRVKMLYNLAFMGFPLYFQQLMG